MTDHRQLLAFYLDWVADQEGTSFIDPSDRDELIEAGLSPEDADELIAVDQECRARGKEKREAKAALERVAFGGHDCSSKPI